MQHVRHARSGPLGFFMRAAVRIVSSRQQLTLDDEWHPIGLSPREPSAHIPPTASSVRTLANDCNCTKVLGDGSRLTL
jgi:hypothetical protein